MRKRRPPIAKSLLKNAVSAMYACIEIHNKPSISYRYETSTILLINSRELLLKAFIYKQMNKKYIFYKDNEWRQKTRDIIACATYIASNSSDSKFKVIEQNLLSIYKYRNKIIHYYYEPLDPVIFSLFHKNISLFKYVIEKYFDKKYLSDNNLLILPLWFSYIKKPIEVMTDVSHTKDASKEVVEFLDNIAKATHELNELWIDESIFTEHTFAFYQTNNRKNSELLVEFDAEVKKTNTIKKVQQVKITWDINAKAVYIDPEQLKKQFPLSANEMRKNMRSYYSDYPDWKWLYNKYKKQIDNIPELCYQFRINPLSQWKPAFSKMYSENVYKDFFDQYYTRKND